ncbi:MAG: RNA polymerase sigma factor [Bacteroidota bacterium]
MDKKAFKKHVLPVKDKLYRLAFRLLSEMNEAQDAVQEVLLKLWDQRQKLAEINNIEAWAMRITRNHCLDRLRARKNRVEELNEQQHQLPVVEPSSIALDRKEMVKQIRQLMNRLPENQRLVMHLRDIEGYTYKEIMETLDMPENQVKTNLFRARKKMRAYLLKTVNYG